MEPDRPRRHRRTQAQTEACQAQAYLLKTQGGMTFYQIARASDPTGGAPTLYANASAARAAYLAHAQRVRGTEREDPLTVTERRALMDDRFERIIQTWLHRSLQGSENAAMIVLRALAGQRELHGLNTRAGAPQIDEGPEDVADELADRRAKSRAAARAAAIRDTAAAAAPPPATE
jgi:hypothetical protein